MDSDGSASHRAFILGLDGVPWGFVAEHATSGALPTFGRLFEEGVAGPLESTIPATTPLAWPSIMTGVGPDKHGIYGFQRITPEYTQEMYTSGDRRQPALWDVLSPSIVGNVPMTYPATPIDGRMLSGMMTPTLDQRATHPPDLVAELRSRVPGYRVALDWQEYTGAESAFLDAITDLVARRREAMRLLMEGEAWRFFAFVFTAPDRLQHLVWEEDVLLEHYRQLDGILEEVMAYVEDRDATLYVVSDHGFGPIEKLVSINRVLAEAGLLVRRDGHPGGGDGDSGLVPAREAVSAALRTIGLDGDDLRRVVPDRVFEAVAARLPGDSVLYDTDFGRTRAFMHGPGNVYVNGADRFVDGPVPPSERDAVKRAVRDALEAVVDPGTGERPVTVHDGDDLFPADDRSPDLVVDKVGGYECTMGFREGVFSDPGSKAGNHRPTGVFAAWGPTIRQGETERDTTVYDVAPTVLHGLGEPIPARADGRPMTDVFVPGSVPATRDPESTRYDHERDDDGATGDYSIVEARLEGLGYLE